LRVLVTYDGSADAEFALRFGALKVRESGGGRILLYVLQGCEGEDRDHSERCWSLSGLTENTGVRIGMSVLLGKGDPKGEILRHAAAERIDLIVAVSSCFKFLRDVGIPVSQIPATILVPMDDRQMPKALLDQITNEARSTFSKILLMGIIPIHLYNPSEEELEEIKLATLKAVQKAAAELSNRGIKTEEMLKMGYPDEEIINTAEELEVSLIVIPCTKDQPSELKKAASIILDEVRKVNIPILYVPV
jgi:nucleotide-binding universal stress UspA family protein